LDPVVSTSGALNLLELQDLGEGRFAVRHPDQPPEARDVVYGGQLLAQMIMAASRNDPPANEVKAIHVVYARTGSYSAPMELTVEPMHAGRSLASGTVSAWQGERLVARALLLMSADEPDFIRHQVPAPRVPGPEESVPVEGLVFPGAELRAVEESGLARENGASSFFWIRYPNPVESVAANQAIVAWATQSPLTILNIGAHPEITSLDEAHRTLSAGPLAHSIHFHEQPQASDWLLFANEGTYAGRGRTFGRGMIFTQDGSLVANYAQDGMARVARKPLDFNSAM
jgi:acyl-CoA thioesterase II